MKKTAFLFLIATLILTPFAFASEGTTGDYFADIATKLGRGLWNVITSPVEIPCTMQTDFKEDGMVGVATGFTKGLVYFVRRALVGVTEVGTFMIPMEATIPHVCEEAVTTPV